MSDIGGRMRTHIAAILLISLAMMGGLLHGHTASAATSRGIDFTLKQSEAPGAAISGTVRLYEESYALVIGIDDYTGGWPRLSNAVRDARLVAETLRARGFHVDFRKNLRFANFTQALKDFFAIRGENPEARLFLWYAGHGHSEHGEGFLVPADAHKPSARGRFKLSAIHMRDFEGLVRLAESRHVFAVFDACFAGTIFKSGRGTPPPAITRKTTLPVRQFLTSGDADQEVPDDGRFRKLFLRAITGEAPRADANGDGYLTGSELGLFMEDRVAALTSGRLTPRYGKLLDEDYDRGDFVFALPVAAESAEASGV